MGGRSRRSVSAYPAAGHALATGQASALPCVYRGTQPRCTPCYHTGVLDGCPLAAAQHSTAHARRKCHVPMNAPVSAARFGLSTLAAHGAAPHAEVFAREPNKGPARSMGSVRCAGHGQARGLAALGELVHTVSWQGTPPPFVSTTCPPHSHGDWAPALPPSPLLLRSTQHPSQYTPGRSAAACSGCSCFLERRRVSEQAGAALTIVSAAAAAWREFLEFKSVPPCTARVAYP